MSRDHITAFQPRQQREIPSQKKEKKRKSLQWAEIPTVHLVKKWLTVKIYSDFRSVANGLDE